MALEDNSPYDSAEYLDSDEAIEEYIESHLRRRATPGDIARALGVIARAQNMTKLAEETRPVAAGALQGVERRDPEHRQS